MPRHLFIGGPLDGQRIDVPEHQEIYRVIPPALRAPGCYAFPEPFAVRPFVYVLTPFLGGHVAFVPRDFTTLDIIGRLFAHYRPRAETAAVDYDLLLRSGLDPAAYILQKFTAFLSSARKKTSLADLTPDEQAALLLHVNTPYRLVQKTDQPNQIEIVFAEHSLIRTPGGWKVLLPTAEPG